MATFLALLFPNCPKLSLTSSHHGTGTVTLALPRDQEAHAPEGSCLPHRPAHPSPQNLWPSPGGPGICFPLNTPTLCSQAGV